MKSMFTMGIQKASLGQTSGADWASVIADIGFKAYTAYDAGERYEDQQKYQEEQAAKAQAREDAALKFQQDMMKNIQEQNAPKPAGTPGAPGSPILGMKPVVFYSVAGLTAGALILGTIMLTKGN